MAIPKVFTGSALRAAPPIAAILRNQLEGFITGEATRRILEAPVGNARNANAETITL